MGACPYCRSTTLPSDTICYSCGRVLPSGERSSYRLEQQFNRGSKDTTYKMAQKPSKRGIVQTHIGTRRNIMKRQKNKVRSVALVALIGFVMMSPAAQEAVFSADEFLLDAVTGYHVYPVEASYTLSKIVDLQNKGAAGYMVESILIPPVITTAMEHQYQFEFTDGSEPIQPMTIQQTNQITVVVEGSSINVPIDGLPSKSYEERVITSGGHEVWWPGLGSDINECEVANCVLVKMNLAAGASGRFSFDIDLSSHSYSWWSDTRVDPWIPGQEYGINLENSGTFADIANRDSGLRQTQFGSELWYERDGGAGYAINAQDALVTSTADLIASSLPEGRSDNAYAFARAAFDFLHANVVYDTEAPSPARSGPACLASGLGDCDEQTNAFFSILRTRGIPGWYAFGVLGDPKFTDVKWEAHAWGYIQLPMNDEWCEEKKIVLSSCYVEGSVDVVNNKWLLNTPTAYVDWIEGQGTDGTDVNNYFHPVRQGPSGSGVDIKRVRSYDTIDSADISGGNFKVNRYAENLK